jgi:hypothetical protein
VGLHCQGFFKKIISLGLGGKTLAFVFEKLRVDFPACSGAVLQRKQVWKGLGCGEGKNLSLKGFPFPAFKGFQNFANASDF